ncbi:MAG: efflux RND transporter permease subunit [Phycisphaerae bacterium]
MVRWRTFRLDEVAVIGRRWPRTLLHARTLNARPSSLLNVAEGSNLGHLVAQVESLVDPIVARHGYTVKYGGQFEAQQSASHTITLFSGIVVLIMLVLLNLAIRSLPVALLVLVNLPLALIGGVVAIFLTESPSILGNTLALFGLGGTYTCPGHFDRQHGWLPSRCLESLCTLGILLVNHYKHLI